MQASVSSHNIRKLCPRLQNLCGNIQIDSFFSYRKILRYDIRYIILIMVYLNWENTKRPRMKIYKSVFVAPSIKFSEISKQSCKHTQSAGEILGCDNKTILVSTLLSSRSHNGFLTFYVTPAYFVSGLISPSCPVVQCWRVTITCE